MLCSMCQRDLPEDQFYANSNGNKVHKCKQCTLSSNTVSRLIHRYPSPDSLPSPLSRKQAQDVCYVITCLLAGGRTPRFARHMDLQAWYDCAAQRLKELQDPNGLFAVEDRTFDLAPLHPEATTMVLTDLVDTGGLTDETRQELQNYFVSMLALEDLIRQIKIPKKFYKYHSILLKAFDKHVYKQRLLGYSNNAWHKMLQCVDDMCYSFITDGFVNPQALSEFLQVPETFRQPIPEPFMQIYDNGLREAIIVSEATLPDRYREGLLAFTESVIPPKFDRVRSIYTLSWYSVPYGFAGYLRSFDPPITTEYWDDPMRVMQWSGVVQAN